MMFKGMAVFYGNDIRDVQLHFLGFLKGSSPDVREVALQDPVGQQADLVFMRRPLFRHKAVQLLELLRIGERINVVFDLGRQGISPVGITLQARDIVVALARVEP